MKDLYKKLSMTRMKVRGSVPRDYECYQDLERFLDFFSDFSDAVPSSKFRFP